MTDLSKLATYGGTGVAIAMIIATVYVVCKLAPLLINALETFRSSLEANTKVTVEMHEFLRNLNGKLVQAIKGAQGDRGARGQKGEKGDTS
jgi:predicted protein tyrosine phosphatase